MHTLKWPTIIILLIVMCMPAHAISPEKADINTGVKAAWQAYLAGKHKFAAKELKRLAKNKDAHAQNYLGSLHASGLGVKENQKLAALWYERAAKQGLAAAQFNLGFLLLHGAEDGKSPVRAHPKVAAQWLAKAAKQNETGAQYLLCRMYHQGHGVAQNYSKAITLCRKAAEKNLAGAQFELGILLIRRLDTKQFAEAYRWFLLAAKQRFPGARHNVQLLASRLKADEKEQAEAAVKDWSPQKQ